MTQPQFLSLGEASFDELSDDEIAERMESTLQEAAENRLIHTWTCIHMDVVKEKYDDAYKSTVEYLASYRARLEKMTDEQREEERRRARTTSRRDFG